MYCLLTDKREVLISVELRTLRYFVAVAEEQHFHRAAERLHIAQPGLSQQIRRLEQELKTPLFTRTTRNVDLTDAGRVLLVEGRRVLAEAEHALAAVTHAAHGEIGTIRLGFVSSAALGVLPEIVLAAHHRWPGIDLQLRESTTGPQLEALREGRLDVGIVREVGKSPGLIARRLRRERLLLAVHRSHRLADRGEVGLADLSQERFVVFPRSQVSLLYDHIAALCAHAGFHLEIAQEAVQFPTILGLVASNTGVAIVPESLQVLQLPDLVYLRLSDPAATSVVSIVSTATRAATPLVRNFLDVATSVRGGD